MYFQTWLISLPSVIREWKLEGGSSGTVLGGIDPRSLTGIARANKATLRCRGYFYFRSQRASTSSSGHLATDMGLLSTPPYAQHCWAQGTDINGGWPDQNLIAGVPVNRGGDSDTILE
ncbi:hypothetical protein A2U01_0010363, partial [Trifolium medium]|nr:hypothetical protein [Trifolium medium]